MTRASIGDPVTPLVAQVVHGLDFGGLEAGIVNLLNGLPAGRYRHAIICLTSYSDFHRRIRRDDVEIYALDKKDGKDPRAYLRLWRLLRRLRPGVVHTHNAGTLDCAVVAGLAGVPSRLHTVHGWESGDSSAGGLWRRFCQRFVGRFVVVCSHLSEWLASTGRVEEGRIQLVHNGVDVERFRPGAATSTPVFPSVDDREPFVIGTVGRLDSEKAPEILARAFVDFVGRKEEHRVRARLLVLGDGPRRSEIEKILKASELEGQACLLGWRDDVESLLRQMSVFVLPSLSEGFSYSVLEAMATGLPVIAADVGGNRELIEDGRTGVLTEPGDVMAIADHLEGYFRDEGRRRADGEAGRRRVESQFREAEMLAAYDDLYSRACSSRSAVGG